MTYNERAGRISYHQIVIDWIGTKTFDASKTEQNTSDLFVSFAIFGFDRQTEALIPTEKPLSVTRCFNPSQLAIDPLFVSSFA